MNIVYRPDLAGAEVNLLDETRSDKNLEARARRAARRVGLVARKSRWRVGSLDNYGGFAILDPSTNFVVYGWGYDLEPDAVIEYCTFDQED